MKRTIIIVSVLVLLVLVYAVYKYQQPVASTEGKSADIELSAEQLFLEFSDNEAEANAKYVNKVLLVEGDITGINKEDDGSTSVLLQTDDLMFGVNCRFEKDQSASLEKYKEGESIRVKGICEGMLSDVILNRCVLASK